MRSFFFEILETILIALAVFLIVSTSIQTVRVQGLSMDPTVTHGQFLLVNKLVSFDFPFLSSEEHIDSDNSRISLFSYPSAGDLIVFHLSDDQFVRCPRITTVLPTNAPDWRDFYGPIWVRAETRGQF